MWVTLDAKAPNHNLHELRKGSAGDVLFCATVKSNAYGHGVEEMVRLLPAADWFGVNSYEEGMELRALGVTKPILLLGYVPTSQLAAAVQADLRLTVYNRETLRHLAELKPPMGKPRVHLKIETGTGRQGVMSHELDDFLDLLVDSGSVEIEGLLTHYANSDDPLDSAYAEAQLGRFREALSRVQARGIAVPVVHTACTAACILYPQTHFSMIRAGIGLYGLWPSRELRVATRGRTDFRDLRPVLGWKTRVAQVKTLPKGSYVGYGCTYKTTRETRLAVLPVGYADGYDRSLGNTAHVLIRGQRAPVIGRVCMNLTMTDVTDIPNVASEDEVTLLGRDGQEEISADSMAGWVGTINYEIVTRISPLLPRVIVERE